MTIQAWHFLKYDLIMRDGRGPVEAGQTYTHAGPLEICASGLHASERAIDALRYAPGGAICRVECSGLGDPHPYTDKIVCNTRKVLWVA